MLTNDRLPIITQTYMHEQYPMPTESMYVHNDQAATLTTHDS